MAEVQQQMTGNSPITRGSAGRRDQKEM